MTNLKERFLAIPRPTKGNGSQHGSVSHHGSENEPKERSNSNPSVQTEDKGVKLKKSVDLFSGIALIVGTMIGSGIFVSPTGLLERTGSIQYSLLVWGLCGIVSMFGKHYNQKSRSSVYVSGVVALTREILSSRQLTNQNVHASTPDVTRCYSHPLLNDNLPL
jgi:hypothetical protein